MAKKKINKSAEIRDFLNANPKASPAEAAAKLSRKGMKVTAGYISVVKSNMKKKAKGTTLSRTRPSKKSPDVTYESMIKAKSLMKEAGGLEEAKQALDALARLLD